MNDALFVGLLERLRDLHREGKAFSKGKRPGFEALCQGRAGDELHDEGVGFAAGLEAIDLGDVGVVELREELRFALEAGEALLVRGERGRQDLDRHLALEARVGGAIDLAHPALTQLGGDLVGAEPLSDQGGDPIWLEIRSGDRGSPRCSRRWPSFYSSSPPSS